MFVKFTGVAVKADADSYTHPVYINLDNVESIEETYVAVAENHEGIEISMKSGAYYYCANSIAEARMFMEEYTRMRQK